MTSLELDQEILLDKQVKHQIKSVYELLSNQNLVIPEYQRPYKWEYKHVIQLLDDISLHQNKSAYRFGTIVIHKEVIKNEDGSTIENHNIVDGQQRTITLYLIIHSIVRHFSSMKKDFKNEQLKSKFNHLKNIIEKVTFEFENPISIENIKNNFPEIQRVVQQWDEKILLFFLEKCQFIEFVLTDVTEAFQFFDAQNARGKDLDPHDLLKAYHLREFSDSEKEREDEVIDGWENLDTDKLVKLFGDYLFRIKSWSQGKSARHFTKNEIYFFKGITMGTIANFPYTSPMRITHFYVEGYNQSNDRNIDLANMKYPFQLDQSIINGMRFFEFVNHYQNVVQGYLHNLEKENELTQKAKDILKAINTYDARHRIGDKYVRNLFDCALIYYIDKFGSTNLSAVIEKFFYWAFSLRLNQKSVYLASMDNYVIDGNNTFRIIRDAMQPNEVLNFKVNFPGKLTDDKRMDLIVKQFPNSSNI